MVVGEKGRRRRVGYVYGGEGELKRERGRTERDRSGLSVVKLSTVKYGAVFSDYEIPRPQCAKVRSVVSSP